jgi:hypothetical protein
MKKNGNEKWLAAQKKNKLCKQLTYEEIWRVSDEENEENGEEIGGDKYQRRNTANAIGVAAASKKRRKTAIEEMK